MIRFSLNNPISPVNLLQQDHPHQLVRKRHSGEADFKIGAVQYVLTQSKRTADYIYDMAYPADSEFVDLSGEFFG